MPPSQDYTDTRQLRYGHLMIMTDQDHDGSHIKGLIMNFLHHFYPSLLKVPGFLVEFITPIIKVRSQGLRGSFCPLCIIQILLRPSGCALPGASLLCCALRSCPRLYLRSKSLGASSVELVRRACLPVLRPLYGHLTTYSSRASCHSTLRNMCVAAGPTA